MHIRVFYNDSDGLRISARYLFVKLVLLPRIKRLRLRDFTAKRHKRALEKQRKKKLKKGPKKAAAKKAKAAKPRPKRKLDIKRLFPTLLRILKLITAKFFKRIRWKIKRINVVVATGDAAETAIAYGVVSQSLAYMLEFLDGFAKVKVARNGSVSVNADFLSEKSRAEVDIYFSISIGAILSTGIHLAYEYLTNKSLFKGTPIQNQNDKQSKKEKINHGRNQNQ